MKWGLLICMALVLVGGVCAVGIQVQDIDPTRVSANQSIVLPFTLRGDDQQENVQFVMFSNDARVNIIGGAQSLTLQPYELRTVGATVGASQKGQYKISYGYKYSGGDGGIGLDQFVLRTFSLQVDCFDVQSCGTLFVPIGSGSNVSNGSGAGSGSSGGSAGGGGGVSGDVLQYNFTSSSSSHNYTNACNGKFIAVNGSWKCLETVSVKSTPEKTVVPAVSPVSGKIENSKLVVQAQVPVVPVKDSAANVVAKVEKPGKLALLMIVAIEMFALIAQMAAMKIVREA